MSQQEITRRCIDPDKFKRFIKTNGFDTRGQFAEYCGISEKSLRRMLSERSAPITICYSVAVAFGRPFDDIFGPDDSEDIVLWKMCLRA